MTQETTALNQKYIHKAIEWARMRRWICILSVVLTAGVSSWLWYQNHTLVTTDIQIAVGIGVWVLLLLIFIQIGNITVQIQLLQQSSIEHAIRLDLIGAVDSVLRDILAKHIPGYRGVNTHLAVGEELIREVHVVSERYARFQQMLAREMSNMHLAEAIDALVAQSSHIHGVATNVENLTTYLKKRT